MLLVGLLGVLGGVQFRGLLGGLLGVLLGVLTNGDIETKTLPNEGIRRSARNALLVGLLVGLGGVLFFGLLFGLGGGLLVGLLFGGEACLKHVVLRLWLIRNGSTPWNYVRFLDHASERILLRKVGGGYVSIHRMLLEYFAARYVEPSVSGQKTAKPSSIEVES